MAHAAFAGEVTMVGAVNGGQRSAATPTVRLPPAPQAQLELLLDGPSVLESGSAYEARLFAFVPDSSPPAPGSPGPGGDEGDVTYSLVQGPDGLSLDPDSGALNWVPSDDQVGENVLVIAASTPALYATTEFILRVQGLQVEAQAFLPAATGGWIQVLAPASAVAGSSVLVPPGALGASQEIELCTPLQSLQLPEIALGLYVLPAQQLSTPAQVELRYSDAWLAAAGIADESLLALFEFDEAAQRWFLLPTSVPDPQSNKVRVSTARLGRFAVFVRESGGLVPEVASELESFWKLFLGGGPSGQVPDNEEMSPEEILSALANLRQPRGFVSVKGDRFEPTQKNALLIHGLFSSDEGFASLKAWAQTRYDNVKFYNYPSGESIQSNARWLGHELISDLSNFAWGSCIDVYGHSMGGLVARAVIEDEKLYVCRSFAPFVHLSMLGSPHWGAPVPGSVPDWIHPEDLPGVKDLLLGSKYLAQVLNSSPGQGWADYFAIAGDLGAGDDGFVSVSSAVPAGPFDLTEEVVLNGQGHTDLHSQIPDNHVGQWLAAWIEPRSLRSDQIELVSTELLVTHAPLGPFEYETEWESVELTATLRFDADFFLPPWMPIQARWRPSDPELGYCGLEFVKQHLFLDDSYPEILAILQSIPGAFSDDPSKELALHLGPLAGELVFSRRLEDVPVCYPSGYVPQPGVHVPVPDLSLDLLIGSEPDLVLLSTAF